MATQKLYSLKNPVTGEFLPSMSEGAMLRIPAVYSSYWANKKKSVFPEYSEKVEVFPTHALADVEDNIFLYFINEEIYNSTINELNIVEGVKIVIFSSDNNFKKYSDEKIIGTKLVIGDYLIVELSDFADDSFFVIYHSKTLKRETISYLDISKAILHAVAKLELIDDVNRASKFTINADYLLKGYKEEDK